jgi:hypothetical protein
MPNTVKSHKMKHKSNEIKLKKYGDDPDSVQNGAAES